MTPSAPMRFPATTPARMYPACAMLEYASMRLILVWDTATIFPRIIDAAAMSAITSLSVGSAFSAKGLKTRRNPENAAALPPVAMKPLTVVGAPSYTSGAHMWNGNAATLNKSPTSTRARPTTKTGECARARECDGIALMAVLPVAPYTRAMP